MKIARNALGVHTWPVHDVNPKLINDCDVAEDYSICSNIYTNSFQVPVGTA